MKHASLPLRHDFFSISLNTLNLPVLFHSQKSISPCQAVAKLSDSGRSERSGICEHSRLLRNQLNVAQNLLGSK